MILVSILEILKWGFSFSFLHFIIFVLNYVTIWKHHNEDASRIFCPNLTKQKPSLIFIINQNNFNEK